MFPYVLALALQPAPIDLPSIEKTLAAELEETKTPGAALVLVRGEEVLLAKGFGVANVETGERVTPDHLFRLGSTTKLFTALALATLAERGEVDLARPIGATVPRLPAFASELTAHQLLSHTAGIKDEPADYGLHDESALAQFPRGWGEDYRLSPPGVAFSYSNPGFALAGLLAEETTGKPYAEAVKDLLLAPLGMDRATFRPTEAMTRPFSQGHQVTEGRAEVVRPFSDDSRQWPNGFLMATASEMGRFARAFLNGGRLEGREVLSPGAIARVSTPHSGIPYDLPDMRKPKYGYGLFLHTRDGVAVAEHVGTMPGYTSILKMAPEESFAVVLLANQEGVMFEKTIAAAFASFHKKEEASPPQAKTVAMTEPEMEAAVGVYRNRWPVTLGREAGALFLEQFGARFEVARVGPDLYSAKPPGDRPPIPFRLIAGSDGRGELLQMFLWVFKKEKVAP
jgi:CubicO group peptidase (beta-lactamase class C family)